MDSAGTKAALTANFLLFELLIYHSDKIAPLVFVHFLNKKDCHEDSFGYNTPPYANNNT